MVQRAQTEESLVAEDRQDLALGDLDGRFGLGLVSGAARTSGKDGRAVMAGHLLMAAIEARLVTAGTDHRRLGIIGDHDAAETGGFIISVA